jgi:hypothetical protein
MEWLTRSDLDLGWIHTLPVELSLHLPYLQNPWTVVEYRGRGGQLADDAQCWH